MTREKKEPHEVWGELEQAARHRQAERLAAMSDAELDREVEAKGMDPAALRERGADFMAQLRRKAAMKLVAPDDEKPSADAATSPPRKSAGADGEPLATVIPLSAAKPAGSAIRSRGRRVLLWGGSLATAGAAAGVVISMLARSPIAQVATQVPVPVQIEGPTIPPNMPTAGAPQSPDELRAWGLRYCREGRYTECRRSLDEAARMDPAGETRAEIVRARHAIARAQDGGAR